MKQTEIIIETQRITVIQRRRQSSLSGYDAGLGDMPAIDIADRGQGTSADEGFGNNEIQTEENQPCTDSRGR